MNLYDYQWEVIEPALEGKNIIIWLPTGSGKTRAAVYVTKRHLEIKRKAKVVIMVNKVHLVEQHYTKEFHPNLKDQYRVIAISGDSDEKCFFAKAVENNDVIICTAQILQNALTATDVEKHVEMTDFTLLVIDECHHTHKDGVYNKLMESYTEKKLRLERNLPQILGLTASPGTGRATTFEKAKEHILQLCANLDTWKIMSPKTHLPQLEKKARQPQKEFNLTEQRAQDPFGNKLKDIMEDIHDHLDVSGISVTEFGSQIYEQKIVELEKEGAVEFCRKKRVCALHLRKYNDALLIHDTVRMIDAFNSLDMFYTVEKIKKTQDDLTERFLFHIFDGTRSVNRRRRQNSMEKWAALVWALCILGQETWASQRKPPLSVGSSTSPLFEEGPSAGIMTEGNAGFLITDRHVLHHTIITDLNPAFVFNKMATEVNMPLEVQNRFNISVVRAQVSMKHMLRQLEKTFIPPPTPRGGRKKRFIGFLLSSLIMAVVGAVANSVVSTVNVVSIGTLHSRMKELETELDDLNSKLDEYLQGMQNATSALKETTITVNAHSQLHAHSIELLRRFQEERDFQKDFQEPWRHVVNTLLLEAQDTIGSLIRGRIPLYVVPFETVRGVLSKANVGEVSDLQTKMAFELGTALPM